MQDVDLVYLLRVQGVLLMKPIQRLLFANHSNTAPVMFAEVRSGNRHHLFPLQLLYTCVRPSVGPAGGVSNHGWNASHRRIPFWVKFGLDQT